MNNLTNPISVLLGNRRNSRRQFFVRIDTTEAGPSTQMADEDSLCKRVTRLAVTLNRVALLRRSSRLKEILNHRKTNIEKETIGGLCAKRKAKRDTDNEPATKKVARGQSSQTKTHVSDRKSKHRKRNRSKTESDGGNVSQYNDDVKFFLLFFIWLNFLGQEKKFTGRTQ